MNYPSPWVQEKEAAKFLGLSVCTLQRFRRSGKLEPGTHWIYITGKPQSPVQYDLEAVRDVQRRLTIAAVKAEQEKQAAYRCRIKLNMK